MKVLKKDSTVLIASFSPWKKGKRLPINGNIEPMIHFFTPKVKKTVLIDQPYPGSDFVMPRIERYEGKKFLLGTSSWWLYLLQPFLKLTNNDGTHISFKIRDLLSVIDEGIKEKKGFDFFIGFEAINALGGIVLRKLGKVHCVIYYVSDYSPKRYKQQWFNNVYLWLDRYCAKHADVIWDVSQAMQPARIAVGLNPKQSAPVLHVPNALYPKQIASAAKKDIIPYSLVFMGTLGEENGPDIAIAALPRILKKFPQTKLHIVGGGERDIERLKKKVDLLKVKEKVIFHGFVSDREQVSNAIRNYAIALAPYKYIEGSARLYGDATKIRAYLAAGLPTITTTVPPLGKEAEKYGAAIIVQDTEEAIAKAVMLLFTDEKRYLAMRKNAMGFAKNNTWENEYNKAFSQMKTL